VIKINTATPPNFKLCKSEISFEIRGDSIFPITLKKIRLDEPFGDISLEIKILSKATREGYWPKQIITAVEDEKLIEDQEGSDGERETNTWVL
jgi:hypothetical protein